MPIPDHQEATLVRALHTEYDHSTVVVALWRSLWQTSSLFPVLLFPMVRPFPTRSPVIAVCLRFLANAMSAGSLGIADLSPESYSAGSANPPSPTFDVSAVSPSLTRRDQPPPPPTLDVMGPAHPRVAAPGIVNPVRSFLVNPVRSFVVNPVRSCLVNPVRSSRPAAQANAQQETQTDVTTSPMQEHDGSCRQSRTYILALAMTDAGGD